MEKVIEIVVCNGDSAAGRISWLAAQELVLEGKVVWHSGNRPITQNDGNSAISNQIILVDGCAKQCLLRSFSTDKPPYHLDLSDLGIEPDEIKHICRDDINLAKDGIIAECAPVGECIPRFPSGCCC